MHLIRVAERLGARLPASPPPLLRPDGGGSTLALCLCTGPCKHIRRHNSRLCMITGTSKTIDERRHVIDHTALVVAQRRAQRQCPSKTAHAQHSSAVSCTSALENCRTCKTNVDHLTNVLQLENLWVIGPGESASAPRQGCQRPGPKNSMSCNCGISTVSHNCARTCRTCTKEVDHLIIVLQLESLYGKRPRESATAPRQGYQRLWGKHNRGIDHQEKYCAGESLWSSEQGKRWETASAAGCRRPAMNGNCGTSTAICTV